MIASAIARIRPFKRPDVYTAILVLAYLASVILFLHHYFVKDINLYLGLLILPYVMIIRKGTYSSRYFLPFLCCLLLLLFVPAKTVFFFTAVFGMLSFIEIRLGKTNPAVFWLLLVISPTGKYLSSVFGMPVRLWLSEVAGFILDAMGKDARVTGNVILLNGTEFSVDPACAGLGMMLVSLILALFAISHYQRKTNRQLSGSMVILFLGFTVLLNVISNLFRIVMLVLFRIMPGNPMHDLVGIVCLALYVVVVLLYTSGYLFRNHARPVVSMGSKEPQSRLLFLHGALLLVVFYAGSRMPANYIRPVDVAKINLAGYKKAYLETGVLKFENAKSLVYIKPVNCYTPEHNPIVCWTSSGYEFKYMNKEWISGRQICTGILEKGSDRIYTAWWFDNGVHKTVSQLDWRWEAFSGGPGFNLVNVSAATRHELTAEINKLFRLSSFNN